MSEIGITSVELSNRRKTVISGSTGKPLPSMEYKIQNNTLWAKGTSAAAYIVENGQKKDIANEWYDTRDLAACIKGNYYLLGRTDDLIVSFTGENLNPVSVEEKLKCEEINELCLINGREGTLPVLLVSVSKSLSNERVKEILDALKQKINRNNLTGQIGGIDIIEGSLIEKDDFKINRRLIEQKYYDGRLERYTLGKNPDENASDEITDKVRYYFAVALNKSVESVGLSTDFFIDEGGTSLDYFTVIAKLQDDFSVSFPTVAGESLNTVNAFADFIKKNI